MDVDRINWKKVKQNEIIKIIFTNFILFNPDVHKTINSLSFSNFRMVNDIATKNVKGVNLTIVFGRPKIEYKKNIEKECPSSVTRSKKFTAWTVHTIAVRVNSITRKKPRNSLNM